MILTHKYRLKGRRRVRQLRRFSWVVKHAVQRYWLKLRVWRHQLLRHRPMDSMSISRLKIVVNCTCGGSVQSRREGSTWIHEYATCPIGIAKLSRLFDAAEPNKIPRAVVFKASKGLQGPTVRHKGPPQ